MTKLPLENNNVVGVHLPAFDLNQICAAPGCQRTDALQTHHLWRRSFLSGGFNGVRLPSEKEIGNLVRLCPHHHQLVTENVASIFLSEETMVFYWAMGGTSLVPLSWQPPGLHRDLSFENPPEKTEGFSVSEIDVCPSCNQRLKPKVKTPPEEKKNRKVWSIAVPKDHLEDGADVLDTLLEEARTEMGKAGLQYGDAKTVKYHVLATALALFVTQAERILGDA